MIRTQWWENALIAYSNPVLTSSNLKACSSTKLRRAIMASKTSRHSFERPPWVAVHVYPSFKTSGPHGREILPNAFSCANCHQAIRWRTTEAMFLTKVLTASQSAKASRLLGASASASLTWALSTSNARSHPSHPQEARVISSASMKIFRTRAWNYPHTKTCRCRSSNPFTACSRYQLFQRSVLTTKSNFSSKRRIVRDCWSLTWTRL